MNIRILPNSLVFEGTLDEQTSIDQLKNAMKDLSSQGIKPPILLDFSKVQRANSIGIVTWLRFIRVVQVPVTYVNCPLWLVSQFNMITDFFGEGGLVESLQVPFFCNQTDSSRMFTLQIGKDIPILSDYSNFKLPNREIEGKEYEADIDSEQYFAFIVDNFSTFQKQVA